MKEHSYFSNLGDDDLVEFSEDQLLKIGKLRKALKQMLSGEIEDFIRASLKAQGIKTYTATKIAYLNGSEKIHQNHWFGHGIACRLLKIGNQSWQPGKIKIRIEIEFFSNEKKSANTDFNEIIEVDINEITDIDSVLDVDVDDELNTLRRQLMDL